MSQSEDLTQRRREKILARATSADEESEPSLPADRADVFDRYKLIKEKQAHTKTLILVSRFAGLPMLLLTCILPPWMAYLLVVVALLVRAYIITSTNAESGKELDWLIGKVPLLGKLKHLDRVVLMGKVLLNSIFSFIMTAVIVNAIIIKHHQLLPERAVLSEPIEL